MGDRIISLDFTVDGSCGHTGFAQTSTAEHLGIAVAHAKGPRGAYRKSLIRNRSLTVSGPIREHERATDDELADLMLEPLPRTRSDCASGYRPCPYVSCRHHLYIEVNPVTGSVQFPFGALELDDIPRSCSLDAADDGPLTLEEVGRLTSRTKERIRQLETRSLVMLRAHGVSPSMLNATMADWLDL